MVVLRRLAPDSLYPVRLGSDPRLALEVLAVSQAYGGTAALLRAIDHRLDHRCVVQGRLHAKPALGDRDLLRLIAELMGPDASSVNHVEPIPDRRQRTALSTWRESPVRFRSASVLRTERRPRPTHLSGGVGQQLSLTGAAEYLAGNDPPSAWVSIVASTAFAIALAEPFAPSGAPP